MSHDTLFESLFKSLLFAVHKIEWQGLSFKFNLNLYQAAKKQYFFYVQYQRKVRNKTRTRVQMKDFKLRLFKNLFLRFINKSAFTAVHKIKLVEMPVSRMAKSHVVEACKNCVISVEDTESFCFSSLDFPKAK